MTNLTEKASGDDRGLIRVERAVRLELGAEIARATSGAGARA